jgi:Tol biopolymer transport system component
MSQTGRYVLFESESRMLAPRDGPGVDLFLRDRRLGTTRTVTELVGPGSNSGGYYPSITANGRYVAFTSYSANLVPSDTNNTFDLFIHDVRRQTTTRLVPPGRRQTCNAFGYISADGQRVAFTSEAVRPRPRRSNRATDVSCTTSKPTRPRA